MEEAVTSARQSLAQGWVQLCFDQAAISRAGERTCHFTQHSPHGGQMTPDRAAGHSPLLCSVGKGPFLTYLWQPPSFFFFFFFWEPSQAFLPFGSCWPTRKYPVSLCSLVEQSPKVSWVSLGRGVAEVESPHLLHHQPHQAMACVCNSLLKKPSDSDKGIQWSPMPKLVFCIRLISVSIRSCYNFRDGQEVVVIQAPSLGSEGLDSKMINSHCLGHFSWVP